MSHTHSKLALLLAALALSACSQAPVDLNPQVVTEIIVNSTLDQPDADPVDDICDADPGSAVRCTLRAAVMQANLTPSSRIIRLQPTTYRLSHPGANEDQGLTGDLDIRSDVELVGTSAGNVRTVIDASGSGDRVLELHYVSATLRNLVITGGKGGKAGGGILIRILKENTALISDSVVKNNAVSTGGGIHISGFEGTNGTVRVRNSVVRHNAGTWGGGIFSSEATLTLERTTIRNNTAPDDSSLRSYGGGLYASVTTLTLRDSTVENNTSDELGGGIYIKSASPDPTTIERSLIAGNRTGSDGGGVYVAGSLFIFLLNLSSEL